jgi:uncharacterized protein (DUF58 family)
VLTRSGVGTLVTAVALTVGGLWWHYEELVIAAAGLGAITLMAVWTAQRPFRVDVRRKVVTVRVARRDPIQLAYRITNDSKRRTGAARLIDGCDDATLQIDIPAMAPVSAVEREGTIPTRRRGVFEVGPWLIERVDPFGLAVGRRAGDPIGNVIVHPKIYELVGPHGAMQTVELETQLRRIANDPMSGFVSLREYIDGDDPRLIHWPTTARTGALMVREHVELRRPEFTVVLDTAAHVASPDDFEEMADVAASIAVHAVRNGLDAVVRTTDRAHAGHSTPLRVDANVLDLLTPVRQTSGEDLLTVAALFLGGITHTSIVLVTGPAGPSSRLSSWDRMAMVKIGVGAELGPGVAIAARDAADFSQWWRP